MKKILITIFALSVFLTVNSSFCLAYQLNTNYKPVNAPTFMKEEDAKKPVNEVTVIVLQTISGALLYFAAPVAVILIAMAAFTITSAAGETDKIDQGKKHLTWAVLGLLLIILSYSTARYVIKAVVAAGENSASPAVTDTKKQN